jgi:hypothetical protein
MYFKDFIFYFKLFILFNIFNSILSKGILDYSHDINSQENKSNLDSESSFMFRINVQKNDFLKGKFCYYCKNYNQF